MFEFLKDRACSSVSVLRLAGKHYPIGVDVSDDAIKLVQLENKDKGISLVAGGSEDRPDDVTPGSANWQRWAIDAIHRLTENSKFRGREVVAALPAGDVFIDHIRVPKTKDGSQNAKKVFWGQDNKLQEAVLPKIKEKLPFEPDEALIKCIPTEDDNVMVIAADRIKIDRHLAIYEQANLQIKSIGVWPAALTNTYAGFFGRRKTDLQVVVVLLDIEPKCTNIVISRHKDLMFARSIPIGTNQLHNDEIVSRLVLELTGCRRHFSSMYKKARIERMIFLSGQTVEKDICATIAKQLEIPAQMGDCLAAVETANLYSLGIERRESKVNWATAFGLSLS